MRHSSLTGALLLFGILAPTVANAQTAADNGFSLGIVLGDPTGLTLRNALGARSAVQAHLGFSPFPGDAVAVMVDWTYDAWNLLPDNPTASLLFYFGVGGKGEWFTGRYYAYDHDYRRGFSDQSHVGLGVRGLVGLRMPFQNAPFDLFVELAPLGIILLFPDPGVYYDIDGAFGARYRF